jgi:hypothetical protein
MGFCVIVSKEISLFGGGGGHSSFLKHLQTAQHGVFKVKLMMVFIHLPERKALNRLNRNEGMTQHT